MSSKNKPVHIPLALQFRHMPKSPAILQTVQQQLVRFAAYSVPGTHCEVVLDEGRTTQNERICDVSVRLNIPGQRLYAAHCSETSTSPDFAHNAIYTAFGNIKRQIRKHCIRRRRQQSALAA